MNYAFLLFYILNNRFEIMKPYIYKQLKISPFLWTLMWVLGMAFGVQAQSPGGVSGGLVTWLKANDGVSSPGHWKDRFSTSLDGVQPTVSFQPLLVSNAINFNPAFVFDGIDDSFSQSNTLPTSSPFTAFIGARTDNLEYARTLWEFGNDHPAFYYSYGKANLFSYDISNTDMYHTKVFGVGEPGVLTFSLNNANPQNAIIGANGSKETFTGAVGTFPFGAGKADALIGAGYLVSYPFKGAIGDMILYNRVLTPVEQQRVETYVALKYGITLSNNYLASDGSVIYDVSSYSANVTGIGRDDDSELNQKQSKSVNVNVLVTVGLGTIATTNQANTNTFTADKSYLIFGDNGLSSTYSTVYTPNSFTPTVSVYSMSRIWKVQESGTVGTVTISIPGTTPGTYLLVNSSASFSSGATEYAMTPDGNGNLTAQVDLTDGQYFTFAKPGLAPGGVMPTLALWMKADADLTTGATMTWADQSPNGLTATQSAAASQPTFKSNAINFNPALTFPDNSNNFLAVSAPALPTGNISYSIFSIAKATLLTGAFTGYNYIYVEGNDAGNQRVSVGRQNSTMTQANYLNDLNAGPITTNVPYLLRYTRNSTNGTRVNGLNGVQVGTDVNTGLNKTNVAGYPRIGNTTAGAGQESWDGDISEVIIYSSLLSAAQTQQVESYLALKYGITLDQATATNYLAGDGSVVWNAATNSGYKSDITGIGRDDLAGLYQKQSKSVNSTALVTMGLGTIAATNQANTNTFAADKSYLIFGDNGLSSGYATAYTATTFTPSLPNAFLRMSRAWKVQETGTVGTVTISIVASGEVYLMKSAGSSFASAATTGILMTPDGNGNLTAQVDFTNGDYFTFGRVLQAPGGVAANLNLWMKGDAGTSTTSDGATVSQWNDNSTLGNVAVNHPAGLYGRTNTANPVYKSNAINFNPAVTFSNASLMDLNQHALSEGNIPWTILAMTVPGTNTNNGAAHYIFGEGLDGGNQQITAGHNGGSGRFSLDTYGTTLLSPVNSYTVNRPYLQRFTSQMTGSRTIGVNGKQVANDASSGVNHVHGTNPGALGGIYGGFWPNYYEGDMAEVIIYQRVPGALELQQAESYLALKYGVTLDQTTAQDYLASDGTTKIWNGATNAAYQNNIMGIGRDDLSTLNQKQSKSINSGFQPTLGLGTGIAATNAANTNTFTADKSFEVFADNGLPATYSAAYTPGSFTPPVAVYSMSRIWRVQETGTVGTVTISIPGTTPGTYLLVKSSASFSSGATEIAMTSDGNGNMTAQVDLADGQYFTFAAPVRAPGGVPNGLTFWFRPEAGVTLSGSKVSAWVDQTSNAYTAVPGVLTDGPTYYTSGSNLMNFNPTLGFTATSHNNGLRVPGGLPALSNGVSVFSAILPNDASNRWFFQWGVSTQGYYNNYGTCSANNPGVFVNSPNGCANSPTNAGPITTPTFFSSRWNSTVGTNTYELRVNGLLNSGLTTGTLLTVPANTALEIGDVNQRSAVNPYTGNISEVFGYPNRVSDNERQRIESYLAIKYGITYLADGGTATRSYLSANSTTVWDATANASYGSNVFGIARDDASALEQKQSKSVNTTALVTVGLGTIDADNMSNTNSFAADNSFLIGGDNGGAVAWQSTEAPANRQRLTREWKVQETGTVGLVKVQVPDNSSALATKLPAEITTVYLLTDADGDFSSGATQTAMTLVGTNWEASIDLTNGQFFTFATQTTPGSFTFGNCSAATVSGTFTANGTSGQSGTLTIPVTGAAAGLVSISVSATDFATSPAPFEITLTAGQTSIAIPITYTGGGIAGSRTLTVTSAQATGSCSPTVTVIASLDTDGDGTPDATDTDDDNDGLSDTTDPKPLDTDNDGTNNDVDTDDDGDGILDTAEAPGKGLDTDNDGTPNVTDTDDDNDGILDTAEIGVLDGSGKYTLPDSDGDGLPDLADALDTDGDGTPDATDTDDDNDGLSDTTDKFPLDTDNDGTPNATDTDDDGDGILDTAEAPGKALDTDNDGTPNATDTDDDNDGILDTAEIGVLDGSGKYTLPDSDGDGLPDLADVLDTDGDGTPDATDTDDDNDGLSDTTDKFPLDTDNDGTPNATDTDDDGDGILDTAEAPGKALDTDNDGTPNVTDTDDDNDGILDTAEIGVLDGSGKYTLPDSDGDGLPDLADALDADGDGVADAIDQDDDNDGIPDSVEGTGDADGDGVPDSKDFDSDNDGINDVIEAGGTDANGDGKQDGTANPTTGQIGTGLTPPNSDNDALPDYKDLDSDNDAVPDLQESGSNGTDADNDGVVDGPDTDGDGIPNSVDGLVGPGDAGSPTLPNGDNDALPDYRDPDSDNDGTYDIAEKANKGTLDADNDGMVDSPTDPDGDGIPNNGGLDTKPAAFGGLPAATGPPAVDLFPNFTFGGSSFTLNAAKTIVINVNEIKGVATSGTLQVFVPLAAGFTFNFNGTATSVTVIGSETVNNADWTVTSSPTGLLFSTKSGVSIPANGRSRIALSITANTAGTDGTVTANVTPVVGETNAYNNIAVVGISIQN
jgi:hypothetical protein